MTREWALVTVATGAKEASGLSQMVTEERLYKRSAVRPPKLSSRLRPSESCTTRLYKREVNI